MSGPAALLEGFLCSLTFSFFPLSKAVNVTLALCDICLVCAELIALCI